MANLMPGLMQLQQTIAQPVQRSNAVNTLMGQLQTGLSGQDDLSSVAGIDKAIMNATGYGNAAKAAELAQLRQRMMEESGRDSRAALQARTSTDIAKMRDETARFGIEVNDENADMSREQTDELTKWKGKEARALQIQKIEAEQDMLEQRLGQASRVEAAQIAQRQYELEVKLKAEQSMLTQRLSSDELQTLMRASAKGAEGASNVVAAMASDDFVSAMDSFVMSRNDEELKEDLGFDVGKLDFFNDGDKADDSQYKAKREEVYQDAFNIFRNGRGSVGMSGAFEGALRLKKYGRNYTERNKKTGQVRMLNSLGQWVEVNE